jgi:hypothetical protein
MDDQVRRLADASQLFLLVDVLLRALGTRILAATALVMTFALFCWAMRLQSPIAFAVAGAFGVGVLWPVLLSDWQKRKESEHG